MYFDAVVSKSQDIFTFIQIGTGHTVADPSCLHSSIKAVSAIFSYVGDVALLELIRKVLLPQIWYRKAAFSRSLNCM